MKKHGRACRTPLALFTCLLALCLPAFGGVSPIATIGQWGTGYCTGTALAGNYAYMTAWCRLYVVDISDPSHPAQVGVSAKFPNLTESVAASGNYAYVAESGMLYVMDATDPTNPVPLGHCYMDSGMRLLASGNYVYGWADSGLFIADVHDPSNPALAGTCYTGRGHNDIALSGNYVYGADNDGLSIIDVSDKSHPTRVAAYTAGGPILGVTVATAAGHTYAFLAAGASNKLVILDVTDPANLMEVGATGILNAPGLIAVSGDRLFMAESIGSYYYVIEAFDISDLAHPASLGSVTVKGLANKIDVSGTKLYLGTDGGLDVIDASNPAAMSLSARSATDAGPKVVMKDGYVLMAGYRNLQVLNVSDPTKPLEVACTLNPLSLSDVAVKDQYAYFVTVLGLYVVDATQVTRPVLQPDFCPYSYARWVTVSGDCLYVSRDNAGIDVLSIADPLHPVKIGHINATGRVTVFGNYALVFSQNCAVYDVTNPVSPVYLGSMNIIGGSPVALGHYLYTGVPNSGLRVYDINNPMSPVLVGQYQTSGSNPNVFQSGGYIYLQDSAGGFRMLDVTDPAHPKCVASNGLGGNIVTGLVKSGDYIYAADARWGFQVLKADLAVSDTTPPQISSLTVTPHLALAGDKLQVTVTAADDTFASSVTVEGVPFTQLSNGSWQGQITAKSETGWHDITTAVVDTSGNTTTDVRTGYKTAQVVGVTCGSLRHQMMSTACGQFLFVVCGKVSPTCSAWSYMLDDGSGYQVQVNLPQDTQHQSLYQSGDFIRVFGEMSNYGYISARDDRLVKSH